MNYFEIAALPSYTDLGAFPEVGDRVMYYDGYPSDWEGRSGTVVSVGDPVACQFRGYDMLGSVSSPVVLFDDEEVNGLRMGVLTWCCPAPSLWPVQILNDKLVQAIVNLDVSAFSEITGAASFYLTLERQAAVRDAVERHYADLGEPLPFSVDLFLRSLEVQGEEGREARTEMARKQRLRQTARARLADRLAAWAAEDTRGDRLKNAFHRSSRRDIYKRNGALIAMAVSNPDNFQYSRAVQYLEYGVICTRGVPVEKLALYHALVRAENADDWKKVVWAHERWIKPELEWHFTHVSKQTPVLIAYHQTLDKLRRDIQTPIKPGAYLRKYYGDVLDEAQIQYWAEKQVIANTPPPIYFVRSDDPGGWEKAYENGCGFQSCMTYDREGRYIHSQLYGEDHPVRAYALPGNGLSLAWIGKPDEDGRPMEVHARAIVDEDRKYAVRVYGDQRLAEALSAIGYTIGGGTGLEGYRLAKRPVPWSEDDAWIVPYLDGNAQRVDDMGDHFVVSGDGRRSAAASAGWIDKYGEGDNDANGDDDDDDDEMSYCGCCDARVHYTDLYSTYDGHGDGVCGGCIGEHDAYTHAVGRRGYDVVVRHDDAAYCESDGRYYHLDCLDENAVVYSDWEGAYFKDDDVAYTMRGPVRHSNAVELNVDDADGNNWAVRDEATELEDGRWVHDDSLGEDAITYEDGVAAEMLEYIDFDGRPRYLLEDSLLDNIDAFAVLGNGLTMVDSKGSAPYGALTLREWLAVSESFEEPANVYDAEDGGLEWAMVLDTMRDAILAEHWPSTEEVEEEVELLERPQQQQAA